MEQDILIRSASLEDIPLIRELAGVTFPDTYREILSPEQMDYMMDWMYSAANLERQMTEQLHKYFIAEYGGIPCGYLSLNREGVADGHVLFHLQKIPFQQLGGVVLRDLVAHLDARRVTVTDGRHASHVAISLQKKSLELLQFRN